MAWTKMPCPTGCGKANGSHHSDMRPEAGTDTYGLVRAYKCKCGARYWVQFHDTAAPESALHPHTYHRSMPPKPVTKLARLAASTYVPPPDTRWFPAPVTPEVTEP